MDSGIFFLTALKIMLLTINIKHYLRFKSPIILYTKIFILLCFFISCSSDKNYVIKAGMSQNPDEPQVSAVRLFEEIVEEKTVGIIRVEIYPNNQLGNLRDIVEGIQLGGPFKCAMLQGSWRILSPN